MNPEQSKRLIVSFLVAAAVVGATVFLFSGGSGGEKQSGPASPQAAVKNFQVPTIGENAFTEEVPLNPVPQNKNSAGNAASTTENQGNLLPLQKSANLTDALANVLSRKISGLSSLENQAAINGIADINSEDIGALVANLENIDGVKQNIAGQNLPPVQSEDLRIIRNYSENDLNNYAANMDGLLRQYLQNNYFQDALSGDAQVMLRFGPLVFEQLAMKLQVLDVPQPLAPFHEKMLAVAEQLRDLVAAPQKTLYSDPLQSILILQGKDAALQKTIAELTEEARALKAALSPAPAEQIHPYSMFLDLVSPFRGLLRIEPANAVWPVFDSKVFTLLTAMKADDVRKEVVKKFWQVLLETLKNQLLAMIQNQLVSWIQGGGKPQFVTNIGQFLGDAASSAVGQAIEATVPGMCQPFQPLIRVAFEQQNYPVPPTTCTLGDVVNNLEGFYNDFQTGGWIAYGQILRPENNIWGVALQESAIIRSYENKKQEEAKQEITQGQGTKDQKACQATYKRTIIVGEYAKTKTDPNFVSDSTEKNESCETATLAAFAGVSGPDKGCAVIMCSLWGTKTPGSQIAGALSKVIGSGLDKIHAANDIIGLISAVMDALINRLTKEGVDLARDVAGGIFGGSQAQGLLAANLIVDTTATECQTDADCTAKIGASAVKLQCVSGYCSASFQGNQCSPTVPCPSGQTCNNGLCIQQDCQRNADCGTNAICYRNSCITCTSLNTPEPLAEQFCDIQTPNQRPSADSPRGTFWSPTADCRFEVTKVSRGAPLYMCAKGIKKSPPDSFGKVGGNCWPQKIKFAGYYDPEPPLDATAARELPYVSTRYLGDKYIKYGRFQAVQVDKLLTFSPKFTCSNNACVTDPFGQYNTETDCEQACRGSGGGGGGGGGGGNNENIYYNLIKSPLAQLAKTAFASLRPTLLATVGDEKYCEENPNDDRCDDTPPTTYSCQQNGACVATSTGIYANLSACQAQCAPYAKDKPGFYYFTAKTDNFRVVKCGLDEVGRNKGLCEYGSDGKPKNPKDPNCQTGCTEFITSTSKGATCLQNPYYDKKTGQYSAEDKYGTPAFCVWNNKDGSTNPQGQPEFKTVVQKVQSPWVYVNDDGDDICQKNADCDDGRDSNGKERCVRSGVGIASENYKKYCVREAIAFPNATPASLWEIAKSAGETVGEECVQEDFASIARCHEDPRFGTTSTIETAINGETQYQKISYACRLGGCPAVSGLSLSLNQSLATVNASAPTACNYNNKKDNNEAKVDCGGGGCPPCAGTLVVPDTDPAPYSIPDPKNADEQLEQLNQCLSGGFASATSSLPYVCKWNSKQLAGAVSGQDLGSSPRVNSQGCVENPDPASAQKSPTICQSGGYNINGETIRKDQNVAQGGNNGDPGDPPYGNNSNGTPCMQYRGKSAGNLKEGGWYSVDADGNVEPNGSGCDLAMQTVCQVAFCAHTRDVTGWWTPGSSKTYNNDIVRKFCGDSAQNGGLSWYGFKARDEFLPPAGDTTTCNDTMLNLGSWAVRQNQTFASCNYWRDIENPPTGE